MQKKFIISYHPTLFLYKIHPSQICYKEHQLKIKYLPRKFMWHHNQIILVPEWIKHHHRIMANSFRINKMYFLLLLPQTDLLIFQKWWLTKLFKSHLILLLLKLKQISCHLPSLIHNLFNSQILKSNLLNLLPLKLRKLIVMQKIIQMKNQIDFQS